VKEPLLSLAPSDLRTLASALKTGHLSAPYSPEKLRRFLNDGLCTVVAESLGRFESRTAAATSLELLAAARSDRPPIEDIIDIATTGPNLAGVANRDTRLVVTEMFRTAEKSVVIAGYAVYQGQKIFEALAQRMCAIPGLDVRMYLDIQRGRDTSAASEIERRFARRLRETQWPAGVRLPEVYYDPRSLATDPADCAALHAKCIIVDRQAVFVSSANFTEAAQEKNIELGSTLRSPIISDRICRLFEQLTAAGLLKPVFRS